MNSVLNILMVGVGGQGIMMASDILALALMYSGYDVKKSEIHGMSQRGGSVFSHIRYGEKVYSPVISEGEADILFSTEEMETVRWLNYAGSESCIISTKTKINPAEVKEYPQGVEDELKKKCKNLVLVDHEALSREIGNIKFLNVALLGLLSTHIDVPVDSWEKAIEERVPAGSYEANWKAFITGKEYKTEES